MVAHVDDANRLACVEHERTQQATFPAARSGHCAPMRLAVQSRTLSGLVLLAVLAVGALASPRACASACGGVHVCSDACARAMQNKPRLMSGGGASSGGHHAVVAGAMALVVNGVRVRC
jgi:hypothetical protein